MFIVSGIISFVGWILSPIRVFVVTIKENVPLLNPPGYPAIKVVYVVYRNQMRLGVLLSYLMWKLGVQLNPVFREERLRSILGLGSWDCVSKVYHVMECFVSTVPKLELLKQRDSPEEMPPKILCRGFS